LPDAEGFFNQTNFSSPLAGELRVQATDKKSQAAGSAG